MRLLFWIAVALIATVLALFAVANRESVALGLWPSPFALDLPLYIAVLGPLLIGFISGVLVAWVGARHQRRENRRRARRIAALERELAAREAAPDRETRPVRLAARG
jgi:lipopolysaccharide assembly protein A